MTNPSSFFDDMSRMAGSAFDNMTRFRQEAEQWTQSCVEKLLARMNLVTREEFEIVRAMAEKAREENLALAKRLDALEENKG